MNTMLTLDRATPGGAKPNLRIADDKAMLRAAAELTRDLVQPNPRIYWMDLIASVVIGYGALAVAIASTSTGLTVAAMIVAMLGLYRALSFIHEVSHMKHAAVPGFRQGWDTLVGIPMLTPSFMYEGVHNLHHAKTRYGTAEDPEYLPLALMKPWTLPLFIVISALAPAALIVRYAILSPISLLSSKLRRVVVERYSALAINPQFRRRSPEGDAASQWARIETAASIWAITLLTLAVAEGSRVQAGQVLGRIELADLASRVAERSANLESMRTSVLQAERTHASNERLAQQQFISSIALDNSRSALETARAQLNAAQAALDTTRVALRDSTST